MSKVFLYIDESKDYKNNIFYIGGIFGNLSFQKMEKYCSNLAEERGNAELKSTKPYDRDFFRDIASRNGLNFSNKVIKLTAKSDKEYLQNLIKFVGIFINEECSNNTSMDIYCDYIRLDSDMKKLEKIFSRKLSNIYNMDITLEFKQSTYRCIQFADLSVGTFRRDK